MWLAITAAPSWGSGALAPRAPNPGRRGAALSPRAKKASSRPSSSSSGANPFASSDLAGRKCCKFPHQSRGRKLPSKPELATGVERAGSDGEMTRMSEADVVAAFSGKGGAMKASRSERKKTRRAPTRGKNIAPSRSRDDDGSHIARRRLVSRGNHRLMWLAITAAPRGSAKRAPKPASVVVVVRREPVRELGSATGVERAGSDGEMTRMSEADVVAAFSGKGGAMKASSPRRRRRNRNPPRRWGRAWARARARPRRRRRCASG